MRNIYAIRDRIGMDLISMQMYILMIFRTHEQAARYFADVINEPTSILNKHPADYELIHCGELADTGHINPLPQPTLIVTGDTIIALSQPQLVKEA